MFPELGHFCLILALCLAGLQTIFFVFSFNQHIKQFNLIRPLALGQVFFIWLSFLILAISFVNDDFSVQYIAHNSNSALPVYYKLTAIWAAHEGSLLLWVLILSAWMLAVIVASRNWVVGFSNKVLAVMGCINLGFLILLLKSSNPFLRYITDIPLDGVDLNPLLQDLGMISHPPILYMGYVGTVVAFAFAIAALLNGQLDEVWAKKLRPWVLIAWVFLTLGITLGSWWAYYELGWGGWWFWDPVENASFMPWLTATALLHTLAVAAKKGRFLRLALFLAISTFALSLLGTFIVRSGVITSVHAFAADPARGVFVLQFLFLAIGGALFLYAIRAPKLIVPDLANNKITNKELGILSNNILLLIATGTVLLGTLYPVLYDVMFAQKLSVGYPYFNAVFVPIILIMLAIMLPAVMPKPKALLLLVAFSLLLAISFLVIYFKLPKLNAYIGLSFALAIIFSTLYMRKKSSMTLGHIGLAVTIIGISITPAYEIEKDLRVQVGDRISLADYSIQFLGVDIVDGPNYFSQRGMFAVTKVKRQIAILQPEKRWYLAQETAMTETAILPGILQDIYIALGQELSANEWSVRIYYKPFVRWIWLGAILMALGGFAGFWRVKRY